MVTSRPVCLTVATDQPNRRTPDREQHPRREAACFPSALSVQSSSPLWLRRDPASVGWEFQGKHPDCMCSIVGPHPRPMMVHIHSLRPHARITADLRTTRPLVLVTRQASQIRRFARGVVPEIGLLSSDCCGEVKGCAWSESGGSLYPVVSSSGARSGQRDCCVLAVRLAGYTALSCSDPSWSRYLERKNRKGWSGSFAGAGAVADARPGCGSPPPARPCAGPVRSGPGRRPGSQRPTWRPACHGFVFTWLLLLTAPRPRPLSQGGPVGPPRVSTTPAPGTSARWPRRTPAR